MSRLFTGSPNWLWTTAAGPRLSVPFSVSCMFYADDADTIYYLFTYSNTATASSYGLRLIGNAAGDKVGFWGYNSIGDFKEAVTSTGFSAATWHNAVGVVDSSRNTAVYIDGGSKGTQIPPVVAPINMDVISFGALAYAGQPPQGYLQGKIAEGATWDVALTDAEVAILGKGYSPLFVRPQSIHSYWRMIGRVSPPQDIIGGWDLTVTGSVPADAHPKIIYPSYPQVGLHFTPASAASPYMTTSPGLWGPL